MKNVFRILAVAMVAVMPMTQAKAGSDTVTYVASVLCCTRRNNTPGVGNLSVGGIRFTPTLAGARIRIVDTTGPGVPWTACQENPSQAGELPNNCGDGDDVSASGCSTGALQSMGAMAPNVEVTVFIGSPDPNCEGVATTGTATASW